MPQTHNDILYEGTKYNFSCVIAVNKTGVDTEFTIDSALSGPRVFDADRIDVSQAMKNGDDYEVHVVFHVLHIGDGGVYTCSASVISGSPNVSNSDISSVSWIGTINGKTHILTLLSYMTC